MLTKDEGVSRTAPATLGLLNIQDFERSSKHVPVNDLFLPSFHTPVGAEDPGRDARYEALYLVEESEPGGEDPALQPGGRNLCSEVLEVHAMHNCFRAPSLLGILSKLIMRKMNNKVGR